MIFAPIALFVYNRVFHTEETVESLKKNAEARESDLFIFSDGAKNENSIADVAKVREYIRTIDGFQSVTIVERDRNLGLANSIIDGVTSVVNRFGKIIVLEDDMISSPYFLKYMNDALGEYQDEERVVSIHAYIYPIKRQLPPTFFIKGADCWGWATWQRGWNLFEKDGAKLLSQLEERKLAKRFNFENQYQYMEMLKRQIAGKNNSWAIRWYASAFLKEKLTLYPGKSLIKNIGNDNSGTHCVEDDSYLCEVADEPIKVGGIPIDENKDAYLKMVEFFKSLNGGFIKRVLKKIFKKDGN